MKTHEIMTVSLPAELREKVKEQAKQEGRNLSNMVAELLRRGMQKEKAA